MLRLPAIVVLCASLCVTAAGQRGGFTSVGHFGGSSPGHFGGGNVGAALPPRANGGSGFFPGRPSGTGFHDGFHHHGFGFPGHGSLISLQPFFGFGTPFGFDGGFFPFFPWFFDEDWQMETPPAPVSPQVIVLREGGPPYQMPVAATPPSHAKVIEVPGSPDVSQDKPQLPATLVLRDGKEITVSRYTIMGHYLYDSSQPRHTTRIPLDQLDLEATERLNAQHGVPFQLPADSNEVMVRF